MAGNRDSGALDCYVRVEPPRAAQAAILENEVCHGAIEWRSAVIAHRSGSTAARRFVHPSKNVGKTVQPGSLAPLRAVSLAQKRLRAGRQAGQGAAPCGTDPNTLCAGGLQGILVCEAWAAQIARQAAQLPPPLTARCCKQPSLWRNSFRVA